MEQYQCICGYFKRNWITPTRHHHRNTTVAMEGSCFKTGQNFLFFPFLIVNLHDIFQIYHGISNGKIITVSYSRLFIFTMAKLGDTNI